MIRYWMTEAETVVPCLLDQLEAAIQAEPMTFERRYLAVPNIDADTLLDTALLLQAVLWDALPPSYRKSTGVATHLDVNLYVRDCIADGERETLLSWLGQARKELEAIT